MSWGIVRIEGCKSGRHLFVGAKKDKEGSEVVEEQVECRIDHYQTPRSVIVSVFGKGADKEKSNVKFTEDSVCLLSLSSSTRSPQCRRLSLDTSSLDDG